MDVLEREAKLSGVAAGGAAVVTTEGATGLSGKLPRAEGVTEMPVMAGLSVELPKKVRGETDRVETEQPLAVAAPLATEEVADEDGEGDRAAEEMREVGTNSTKALRFNCDIVFFWENMNSYVSDVAQR